jgi:hypothetical protein
LAGVKQELGSKLPVALAPGFIRGHAGFLWGKTPRRGVFV